jgi:hypothetical protein
MTPTSASSGAMIVDVKEDPQGAPKPRGRADKSPAPKTPGGTADSRIDQMSDGSFPASDPPSAWTWEVKTRAPAAGEEG